MEKLYPLTQLGFAAVTIIYTAIFFTVIRRALGATSFPLQKKNRIFYGSVFSAIIWLVLIGVLAKAQLLSDFTTFPPRFMIILVVPLITILWATLHRNTGEILRHVRPQHLLYLQSFRVFVEILLWMLFVDGLLPIQMTFEGYNFDILAGLAGPIAGFLFARTRSRTLLIVYNIAGLCLLINIVTIAILSTPVPFRLFMNEPANTIVMQFPIVWLPGLLVPMAYTLHILSLRQRNHV